MRLDHSLIEYGFVMFKLVYVLIFSVCTPLDLTLYVKEEVEIAIEALKQVAEFTEVWNIQTTWLMLLLMILKSCISKLQ